MTGHNRIKNIAYDEDDLDHYDEQDSDKGMSPEDEEQMKLGVIAVRDALGAGVHVPTAKIEESLWYYAFDIDRTIAYLKKILSPPEKPTQKQAEPSRVSKFDQALNSSKDVARNPSETWSSLSSASSAKVFDFSWSAIPRHRLGAIAAMRARPRGCLLGGAGKPSKLAALAAARKKAQEHKKQESQEESQPSDCVPTQARETSSIAPLDKLSLHGKEPVGSGHRVPGMMEQGSETRTESDQSMPRRYKRQRVQDEPSEPLAIAEPPPEPSQEDDSKSRLGQLQAAPSMFASVLVGAKSRSGEKQRQTRNRISLMQPNQDSFAEASPDDRVHNAQIKAKPIKKPQTSKNTDHNVTNGLATLKLDDAPKVRSKNIDAAVEFEKSSKKKAANFVVIGHVDHGKSTLMGQLLHATNQLSSRDLARNTKLASETGKSSFALAWALDSTAEERERGVTIDIDTKKFSTPSTDFNILDAPGHRDFIPNMIAGAAQADFAVLVIDAATNAFEAGLKGQTREHALLVRSMSISRLVVAVNKMDMAQWSEERFNTIQQQSLAFLSSAGFSPKNVVFVPCAGLSGENVVTPIDDSKALWYKGDTLIVALDASEPARRHLNDPLRITVSDVYRTAAPGMVAPISIVGRLDAGSLQIGTVILAQPAGEVATIKSVEVDSTPKEWAVAGQIAKIGLVGIDSVHLRAGDVICQRSPNGDGSGEMKCVRAFTAKCLAFEHIMPGPMEVLRGRLQSAARVTDLLEIVDKGIGDAVGGGKKKKRPRVVKPGMVVRLRVEVEAEKGLPLEVPDRVVLRSEGVTIAAGLLENVELKDERPWNE